VRSSSSSSSKSSGSYQDPEGHKNNCVQSAKDDKRERTLAEEESGEIQSWEDAEVLEE
jgi:hypothetical protein